jgi:uncharacterized protein YecT (DUF1311 family)
MVFGAAAGQTPQTDAFFKERAQLQAQAKTAFDDEMAREKKGDCPNANNTRDINACLGGEVETSTANYKTYVGSVRTMLAQPSPFGGPSGNIDHLLGFDQTEAAWLKYRDAMCAGASGLYKGGTIVTSMNESCLLMTLRSHLRELSAVYGDYLSR